MKIYLAGPWFTDEQAEEHNRLLKALTERTNYEIFNPRINGEIDTSTNRDKMSQILIGNIEGISSSNVVVAIYDGKDTGTIWETGFAYAKKIPIIFYAEKPTTKVNLMLAKTGEFVNNVDDLIAMLSTDLQFKNIYNSFEGEIE